MSTRSIYVSAQEGETGKSTVALGLLDLLTRRVQRVGVYRPVARSTDQRDYVLELLLGHDGVDLSYEECVGVTYDDVHTDQEAALATIVSRYHAMARSCDAVVIVGSDYTDVAGATELSFNARVAANLGSPVLLVVSGNSRSASEVRHAVDVALAELHAHHAQTIGVIANRCTAPLEEVRRTLESAVPAWVLPEEPFLFAPTVGALMTAVDGRLSMGDPELLSREALEVLIGAMSVEHLLPRLTDGAVVIVPGDRSDVLLGLVMAHAAPGSPSLSGIVLNGGFYPPPAVARLVEGLGQRLPIIRTNLGTFRSASAAAATRGRLTADSQRKVDTALALFEKHVDGEALLAALDVPRIEVVTPLMFEYGLLDRARENRKHIVLPEGKDDRILRAAFTLLQRGVADLTILGEEDSIRARATELGLDLAAAKIIDPKASTELSEHFAQEYARLRAHKGMTVDRAREIVSSVSYFGTMMVELGLADGMVSGAMHTTAHTIKPAFEIIKTRADVGVVSSVFLMGLEDRVLVYGDCAVIPDPTATQLADIAISSAETAVQFGIEPRIAMLSYSTGDSGTGADVDKVRAATALVRERRPDLVVDGPMQYDAAVDAAVGEAKAPDSPVAGRATVLVFPDLNTGNNTYKAVQRSAGAVAIGPVLQGLRKPVNDLSRGALVQDIVNTVAITAIQAQGLDSAAEGAS